MRRLDLASEDVGIAPERSGIEGTEERISSERSVSVAG